MDRTKEIAPVHWALALQQIICTRSCHPHISPMCWVLAFLFCRWRNVGSQVLKPPRKDVSVLAFEPWSFCYQSLFTIYVTLAGTINNSWWLQTRKDQQKKKFISRVSGIKLEAGRLHPFRRGSASSFNDFPLAGGILQKNAVDSLQCIINNIPGAPTTSSSHTPLEGFAKASSVNPLSTDMPSHSLSPSPILNSLSFFHI